jgi:phosphatidylserine/phosphatidylglycerophosphate/cardiolipin synthase-like enzyme
MHHKFLVFCDVTELHGVAKPIPRAVWSGSFNATHNGSRSLENALIIRDEQIAAAYFKEWEVVLGLSEPLNWAEPYMQPEYRIGT